MALKPAQLAWEATLLRERLKFVRELKAELAEPGCAVAASVDAYSSLIDGRSRAPGFEHSPPPPPPPPPPVPPLSAPCKSM